MDEIVITRRKIYFYQLEIKYLDTFSPSDGDHFREFYSQITKLAQTKNALRYQVIGEKILFIQDIKFVPNEKKIKGKLRCIRKDILPEIINMSDDTTKGIEVEDEEGIVETTHFVIDYSKTTKRIALEFNQYGARINDFIYYCSVIGSQISATSKVDALIITRDNLDLFKKQINNCSEFVVRVHKTELNEIKKLDNKLYSSLEKSVELFNPEYAELILKFDYRTQPTLEANTFIKNIISKLITNKKNKQHFETLTVKAENSYNNNRIELFDLLIDKARVELQVQKKAKYRSIVSEDILEKMTNEISTLKL